MEFFSNILSVVVAKTCNVNNQFDFTVQIFWFHCVLLKQLKQPFFWLTTTMFWHKRQPIQPAFRNNINRFMYSPRKRHSQHFLFILRAHSYVYLIINDNTNTIRRTQSTYSLTRYRIFSTFDTFCTFHPSLHRSVAGWQGYFRIMLHFRRLTGFSVRL